MPRSLFDIPGANLYNLSLFFVLAGWFFQRKVEPASDLPKKLMLLVSFYLLLSLFAFVRMLLDMDGIYALRDHLNIPYPTTRSVVIDYLLDPIKSIIPGFLIASISLSTQNARLMMYAIFGMGVFLALEVIKVMLPALIGVDDLSTRALRVIDRDVGYHRVATATILSMMASGLFGLIIVLNSKKEKFVPNPILNMHVRARSNRWQSGYVGMGCSLCFSCYFPIQKGVNRCPIYLCSVNSYRSGLTGEDLRGV